MTGQATVTTASRRNAVGCLLAIGGSGASPTVHVVTKRSRPELAGRQPSGWRTRYSPTVVMPLNGGERDATLERHRRARREPGSAATATDRRRLSEARAAATRSSEAVERMVKVGDHVVVESEKVGSATRGGVVTAVDGRLLTVRWDTGGESIFIPSAGSLQVTGGEATAPEVR